MSKFFVAALAIALCFTPYAKADQVVEVTPGTAGWVGFMNVFETPANGGGFTFGSGWGLDYNANGINDIGGFNADSIDLRSASIDDPAAFWFSSGAPGAGAVGNKVMEANLFKEFGQGSAELGSLAGMNLTFDFTVDDFTYDSDVTLVGFIKEFTTDFASVLGETIVPVSSTGDFSITHAVDGTQGTVQYGFRTVNTVVWGPDDVNINGGVTIAAVPEPTSLSLLGLAALGMVVRRRR